MEMKTDRPAPGAAIRATVALVESVTHFGPWEAVGSKEGWLSWTMARLKRSAQGVTSVPPAIVAGADIWTLAQATLTVAEILFIKPMFAVPAAKETAPIKLVPAPILTTPATITVALMLLMNPMFAVPAAREIAPIRFVPAPKLIMPATMTVAEMLFIVPILAVPAPKLTVPATTTVALILLMKPMFAVPAARETAPIKA